VNHYEVLRVPETASPDELRRAYIAQAREHHPDRHRAAGPSAAAAAEDRMRLINEAWDVLRDPLRRRSYDQRLSHPGGDPSRPGGTAANVHRPSDRFTPYRPDTPEDPDEDDAWRYEPDQGDPASVPPRSLLAAPPALFVLGLVLLVLSLVTGLDVFAAVGLICLFGSALLFVGAPVVALFRSQVAEQRAARRRR
jgi:hypothetical protein